MHVLAGYRKLHSWCFLALRDNAFQVFSWFLLVFMSTFLKNMFMVLLLINGYVATGAQLSHLTENDCFSFHVQHSFFLELIFVFVGWGGHMVFQVLLIPTLACLCKSPFCISSYWRSEPLHSWGFGISFDQVLKSSFLLDLMSDYVNPRTSSFLFCSSVY